MDKFFFKIMEKKPTTSTNSRNSTKITYEKTSCYFCNEWLESQTFKEHIIHCGQVIEKCPKECNAFVQRKRLRLHLKECPKNQLQSETPTTPTTQTTIATISKSNENMIRKSTSQLQLQDAREYENRMLVIEQDVSALRSVLNEEIKQRLHLITDVGSLRKHNQISDEWTQKVGDVLAAIKKCINEESSARCNEIARLHDDILKFNCQQQIDRDWHSGINNRLENVHKQITNDEHFRENMIALVQDTKNLSNKKDCKFQNDLELLQQQITLLSNDANKVYNHMTENLTQLEEFITKIDLEINKKLQNFEMNFNKITNDLQLKLITNNDFNTKQMTLDYEVKSMKNIVCETEEKCDKLEKLIGNIERTIHQTHQEFANLEGHLIYQKKLNSIQNTKGHLIWKLSNYGKHFEDAKKYDGTNILGPIFSNKPYGYTFRLYVYLNGLGTWKGRNIIASLNVIPGEYDSLLQWPCKLQADIILKDQMFSINRHYQHNHQQLEQQYVPQDYVKTTIVKGKCEDFHANQFIHIPHKIVESHNFIYNDAIFFEVRIRSNNRSTY